MLGEPYSYGGLWYKDKRAYYTKLHREWYECVDESNALIEDLRVLNCPIIRRNSLTMAHRNIVEYVTTVLKIREENNRMLIQKARYYIFNATTTNTEDNNKVLSNIKVTHHLMMLEYSSNFIC